MKEVKIGNQIWMAENLNIDRYRNGDEIPQAKSKKEWVEAAKKRAGAWTYFEGLESHGPVYGRLYNWFAVNDHRGLAPDGFSIPTIEDWLELIEFAGGQPIAGENLKSKSLWSEGKGKDKFGMNILPGSYRGANGNYEYKLGTNSEFWTCSDLHKKGLMISITEAFDVKFSIKPWSEKAAVTKLGSGLSVRCIKK
jgi:uncharacterized protein (TIGR02145 family)